MYIYIHIPYTDDGNADTQGTLHRQQECRHIYLYIHVYIYIYMYTRIHIPYTDDGNADTYTYTYTYIYMYVYTHTLHRRREWRYWKNLTHMSHHHTHLPYTHVTSSYTPTLHRRREWRYWKSRHRHLCSCIASLRC